MGIMLMIGRQLGWVCLAGMNWLCAAQDIPADYRILDVLPHDAKAFTQGLVFVRQVLYEGTGLYGESTLRRVDLNTGIPNKVHQLEQRFFGEGITVFDSKIYQLTWREHTAFVYDTDTFELLDTFEYATQGWGLTHNKSQLIMSDGSPTLTFRNPDTFAVERSLQVLDGTKPVWQLNELEFVRGEILANVWQTDRIARIHPETGMVIAWINLDGLLNGIEVTEPINVLNGIAYDHQRNRLWVTGKLWPRLFQIEVIGLTDLEARILEAQFNSENRFQLKFRTVQGKRYCLEKTQNVTSDAWQIIAEEREGINAELLWVDEDSPGRRQQFYRIRMVNP